jgi:hypothetical protein
VSDGQKDAFDLIFGSDEDTEPLAGIPVNPWLDWQPKVYPCTCGSETVYGKIGPHSHWCDKIRV